MSCADLHPYFDDELDVVHAAAFEAHLRTCPACTAELERLHALRSAIRQQAPYYTRPRRNWHAPAWIGVAAAAVIAAVLLFKPAPDASLESEIVSAHLRSLQANHLIDVPSSDRHTVKPWFTGKLDFAPDVTPPDGFELIGGRLDYVHNRAVAALIYRRRKHTVNVFVWPATGSDQAPQTATRQGFHLVHWTRSGLTWWAISDDAAEDLKLFAAR